MKCLIIFKVLVSIHIEDLQSYQIRWLKRNMTKIRTRDPLGVGGKWKYQNVRISMEFLEKQKKFQNFRFLPIFWWFSWIFLFFVQYFRFRKSKKIMKFRKIGRFSSFGVSVGLDHLVSENIGISGHFRIFTTHITHFSLSLVLAKILSISLKNVKIRVEIHRKCMM